jgi:vancomycin resistance protein YoaR
VPASAAADGRIRHLVGPMMRAASLLPRNSADPLTLLTRLLLAAFVTGTTFLAALLFFLLAVRVVFIGRALPGVHSGELGLSSKTSAQIEAAATAAYSYPQTGLLALRDGSSVWTAHPSDLGVSIDGAAMADQALAVGRRGSLGLRLQEQIDAWVSGIDIAPVILFDQTAGAAYLQSLAATIDKPQFEATLGINGLEVIVQPGQVGRKLDLDATLMVLEPSIAQLHDAELPLVVRESPPLVLDASEQAEVARRILSQPLTLTADGAGPWTFDPPTLAGMLRFNLVQDSQGGRYQIGVDPAAITEFLGPLAAGLERSPKNARFIFNDETRQLDLLQDSVDGRTLDIPATIEAINAALAIGEHSIGLAFQTEAPAVSGTATAADLGITELVVSTRTYFAGSSNDRVQNIRIASSAFHGLLVAPGETLSMADVLGDISLDAGYAEALIIIGSRTVKGVGGGVCQVSTTLFRAVFYGGYQIDERHPHAYRVGYYEQGPNSPGPGLDATVFAPLVDFKFTNDTDHWLLMETYLYGSALEWKFYSTKDGRVVSWETTGPQNVVEAPEPLYKENDELAEGKIKQVDYEADGADITVTRTVIRDGQVLHHDLIKTHYLPWRAIYEYGPGTELPEGAKTQDD